jgi:hypothetical protein
MLLLSSTKKKKKLSFDDTTIKSSNESIDATFSSSCRNVLTGRIGFLSRTKTKQRNWVLVATMG